MAADSYDERDNSDHFREAADGLETAAKAFRACAEEESSDSDSEETPAEKQPKDLKGAAAETKRRFAQSRKATPAKSDTSDDNKDAS